MHTYAGSDRHYGRGERSALMRVGEATLFVLVVLTPARGQTPTEHDQHHPAAPSTTQQAPAQPVMPGASPAPSPPDAAPSGAMGAGMGDMMKQMGAPPRGEVYPSLMALPDRMTPEERAGIEQLADDRMKAGAALLSSGLEKLSGATYANDYGAMQHAAAQMRAGLAEFESGIAARRVVSEGISVRGLEEIVSVGDLGPGSKPVRRKRPTAPGLDRKWARSPASPRPPAAGARWPSARHVTTDSSRGCDTR